MIGSDTLSGGMPAAEQQASTSRTNRAPLTLAVCVFLLAAIASAYAYLNCLVYGPPWSPPIRSDGYGYYAYLPAVFVDHNLSMKTPKAFRWTVLGKAHLSYEWDGISVYATTGKYLDKYTIGTAVLELPFFGAAMVSAKVLGFPVNGYSLPFQVAIQLSGMVYMSAGVFFLFRYLRTRFDAKTSFLATAGAVLATSVFHYGTYASTHSHAFSFFLFALLLDGAARYRNASPNEARAISAYLGIVVGMITVVRFTNLISVIVPLAYALERFGRFRSTRQLLLELSLGIAAFSAILSPQLMYWYSITGHVFVNSYLGEEFNWLRPQILPFLFSLKRGFFVWTPIGFFMVAGLLLLFRKDRWLAVATGVILLADTYICSSWWSWWFGAAFGTRPFADLMPLLGVPLACSLEWIGDRLSKSSPVFVVLAAVSLNLFLMVSWWNRYLPTDEAHVADFEQLPGRWIRDAFSRNQNQGSLIPYVLGTPFEAASPALGNVALKGWEEELAPAIWSTAKEASVSVRPLLPPTGDLCIDMAFAGNGALLAANHPLQRAVLRIKSIRLGVLRFVLNGSNAHRTIPIPRKLLRDGQVAKISFELPDAVAPIALGINGDHRLLGLYMKGFFIGRWRPDTNKCGG